MQIVKEIKKRHQITLPKKLAVQQGIMDGDFLFFDANNETLTLSELENRGELAEDKVYYVYNLAQDT